MKRSKFLNKCTALFIVLLFSISSELVAQYNFAVGLRAGTTAGITLKKITAQESAIEGILGFCGDCFSITGLYEKNPQILDIKGLNWYYGVGLHVTFYVDRDAEPFFRNKDYDNNELGLGIDGIVGLEYKIPDIPLAISIDLKPFIEITTQSDVFFWFDPGIGIKLAFPK
ncbi:MAG: hypothetical protein HC906_09990 [Bacteroidales bacterium]|nr:hypothetical protein [Bacteroidales bacterium]